MTAILVVFFIEPVSGDESHSDTDHSKDGGEIEDLAECDRHVSTVYHITFYEQAVDFMEMVAMQRTLI